MVGTCLGDERIIAALHKKLQRGGLTLPQKYRILCSLRNCSNPSATEALLLALRDGSALFRHDVAFALGQRQDPKAIQALITTLDDPEENGMVRHEAAEALGAIGTEDCIRPLHKYLTDPVRELAETCQLASQRIKYFAECTTNEEQSHSFVSVDPTPPFPDGVSPELLAQTLNDPDATLFDRYRALFSLRNRGGIEAVHAMARCLQSSSSALLKHEVAYVYGQMQDANAVGVLSTVLQDVSEHAMVRHEAAEALGSIASDTCVSLLQAHVSSEDAIVADSCVVALDMIEHAQSGAFEYADMCEDELES